FKQLYLHADGQQSDTKGLLLGHRFMSSHDIIRQLKFSRTLVKLTVKTIDDPKKSKELIQKILNFYLNRFPKHRMFGLKKSWHKIEFKCGIGSYGGPYLYAKETTTSKEREVLRIDYKHYESIVDVVKELHKLEEKNYNWDELNFVVYSNGRHEVERSFYNFDNEISFTSTPTDSIKKKYFHFKWIPIFSDLGGNYIGMDLDP